MTFENFQERTFVLWRSDFKRVFLPGLATSFLWVITFVPVALWFKAISPFSMDFTTHILFKFYLPVLVLVALGPSMGHFLKREHQTVTDTDMGATPRVTIDFVFWLVSTGIAVTMAALVFRLAVGPHPRLWDSLLAGLFLAAYGRCFFWATHVSELKKYTVAFAGLCWALIPLAAAAISLRHIESEIPALNKVLVLCGTLAFLVASIAARRHSKMTTSGKTWGQ